MLFSSRAAYDFGPQLSDLNVAVGVKNIFNNAVLHTLVRRQQQGQIRR